LRDYHGLDANWRVTFRCRNSSTNATVKGCCTKPRVSLCAQCVYERFAGFRFRSHPVTARGGDSFYSLKVVVNLYRDKRFIAPQRRPSSSQVPAGKPRSIARWATDVFKHVARGGEADRGSGRTFLAVTYQPFAFSARFFAVERAARNFSKISRRAEVE
jgi:hypothetical protein